MSPVETTSRITVKPGTNVYTGLAVLSVLATLGALIFAVMQYRELILK